MSHLDPPRSARRHSAVFSAAFTLLVSVTAFAAPRNVEGPYQAGAAQFTVKVGTWGEDCGPRPTSRSEPGGAARVARSGTALVVSLPDSSLRTDACWTPNPAARVASANATDSLYRVECKTAASDAKRETGRYALSIANDGSIALSEESNYDWQLKSSHCVASVKRVQTLTPGAAAPVANTPAPAPVDSACVPGPASRLRLKPAEAHISPGQRVCFQVQALDAAGCVLKGAPAHGPLAMSGTGTAVRGEINGMCFTVDPRTAVGAGSARLRVEADSLRAEAVVKVAAPDLSAITADQLDHMDTTAADAAANEGVFSAGVRAVVAGTGGHPVLAALLLAAAVALIFAGVRRRQIARMSDPDRALRSVKKPSAPTQPGETWVCPRCRRGYPAGTSRCSADGEAPIPYAEFRARTEQAGRSESKCASCGSTIAPGSAFCGVCGKPRSG